MTGEAVAAKHVVGRMPARELDHEYGDDRTEQEAVEHPEVGEHAEPSSVEPGEEDRCRRDGGDEHDRLRAREKRQQTQGEERQLPQHGWTFEREHQRERDAGEHGIEDGLRHQRARVHQRGHGDGEEGGKQ